MDIPAIKDCAKAAYEMYVERIGKEPAPMQANFVQQLKTHTIDVYEHQGVVVGYIVFQLHDQGLDIFPGSQFIFLLAVNINIHHYQAKNDSDRNSLDDNRDPVDIY